MTEKDRMWTQFKQTGDPMYYMMYKSLEKTEKELNKDRD